MLKKIFSVALMAATILIFATGSTFAASSVEVSNVAVIMEPPLESFEKPEKVQESIQQTLNKIFKYNQNYNVLSIEETAGYVQVYREENFFDAAALLKKSDLEQICKRLDCDFIVYLRITGDNPKTLKESILGQPAKVIIDFRIWSNSAQDFTYTTRVTKTDDYSFEKSLSKGLQVIEKDVGKIIAAM